MSKRKLLSLLGLMTIVCSLTAQTQDAASGLWYTSTVAGHATIVAPPDGEAAYTGAVRIPSTIVGSEGTYTVDTIGKNAFKSSTITLVEIPATVNFIGVYAFSSCAELTTIRCHATTPPVLGTDQMSLGVGKYLTFYPFDETLFSTLSPQVPDQEAYAVATGWEKFTNGFSDIIYNITIAGIEVTAENKDNITGEAITGTISYDNEANVLLLSDATITAAHGTNGIEFYEPDLAIRLEGKNTIKCSNLSCIYVGVAGTITGPGSLENIGDIVTDADLTFKNTTVTAERLYVEDISGTDAAFTFDKAYVTLFGDRNNETIVCTELNLTDCEFLYPASASFNATKKYVENEEGFIFDDIVIGRTYGLVVGDVEVTDRNKDNITGEAITGTISYDSETSTLTLDNASIAATANTGIVQELDSLHINVVGNDTVRGTLFAVFLDQNTAMSISGDGHLYVENNVPSGVFSGAILIDNNATLTVRNTSLEVVSALYGIYNTNNLGQLAIEHSTVSVKGKEGVSAIYGMKDFSYSGCQILSPTDAYYDSWEQYVLLNKDDTPCSEVFIGRTYGITVAGVSVHELNKENVTGEGISGKVSYDSDTKTLTLDNANITSSASACINISKDNNVQIELIGENSLAQTGGTYALYIGQNDTITIAGDGSLAIESSQNGINLSSSSQLTISECQVDVKGGNRGITGSDGTKGETLIVNNAIVRATGSTNGSICNLQTFTRQGCNIVAPTNAKWSNANHQVEIDGTVVTEEITIVPVYSVYIAGVQLNLLNKDDIATAAGISEGTITFDNENNVLTLDNAVIETSESNGIEHSCNLTIKLVGDNKIKTTKASGNGILSTAALTINGQGSGTLTIEASAAVNSYNQPLTITNASVTALGEAWGLYGTFGSELTINKSSVTALGKTTGSIDRFKSITLKNCNIVSPSGAEIGKDDEESLYYSVLQDGVVVTDTIVIEAQTTAIETIEATQPLFYAHDGRIYGAEGMRIYTLLGLDVTHMNGQLNGVYIVKTAEATQKIVVR